MLVHDSKPCVNHRQGGIARSGESREPTAAGIPTSLGDSGRTRELIARKESGEHGSTGDRRRWPAGVHFTALPTRSRFVLQRRRELVAEARPAGPSTLDPWPSATTTSSLAAASAFCSATFSSARCCPLLPRRS